MTSATGTARRHPDIIESLGGNQAFVITGSGTMSQSGTDWAGLLSGELAMGTPPVWSNSSWSESLVRLVADSGRTDASGGGREQDPPVILRSRPGLEAPLRPTAGLRRFATTRARHNRRARSTPSSASE